MRIHRTVIRVLCCLLISAMPGLPFYNAAKSISSVELQKIERQIHQSVNCERDSHSRPQLAWSESLATEARRHARSIATARFFAHEDPVRGDIDVRLSKVGIDWLRCAENIYAGDIGDLAADAVKAWRESPGHRKNMLDSMFSESGVGIAMRSDGTFVVVQEYVLR